MSKAEELQKAILNNIPDQAWLKDKDSRYVLVNDAFIAACGVSEDRVIGCTPADIWPEEWGRKYIDTDRHAMNLGVRLRFEESRYVDGTLHWFDTVKTPIRDKAGNVIGTVGISRDITDRKRTEQELKASRSQLRELSAYLQSVKEEERTRISRELHDELGQSLAAIRIGLDVLETQHERRDQDWQKNLQGLKQITDSTVESVQRIAADLRPLILDELGLPSAIEWLLESFSGRSKTAYQLTLPGTPVAFSRDISTAVFRILQEALTNISRHSGASLVAVKLIDSDDMVTLEISDDGRGMVAGGGSAAAGGGLGLIGMRERAFMLSGELKVRSSAGEGTVIVVNIPKPSEAAAAELGSLGTSHAPDIARG